MGGKKARMAHVFLFNDAIIFTLKNKEKQKVLEEIPLAVDAKVVDSKPDFKCINKNMFHFNVQMHKVLLI